MNLRSPRVESIATYLDLRRDPASGTNSVHVLTPSLAEAQRVAERLSTLPEADRVLTLATLIPSDQDQKLALISQAGKTLEPAFKAPPRPAPTDAENIAALNRGVDALTRQVGTQNGPGAEAANRLSAALKTLANGDQAQRARAEFAFVSRCGPRSQACAIRSKPRKSPPRTFRRRSRRNGHCRMGEAASRSTQRAIPATTRRCGICSRRTCG